MPTNPKLTLAIFRFGHHIVTFFEDKVVIQLSPDGRPTTFENPWVSQGEAQKQIMGRRYKPRYTDASLLLRKSLRADKVRERTGGVQPLAAPKLYQPASEEVASSR